jgi:hypothetical protein
MAIPTNGLTPATSYIPTAIWNASITLIGDSENMIGENSSGETATLNRHVKQVAQNAQFLREITNYGDTGEFITTGSDLEAFGASYSNKNLRFALLFQLFNNLILNAGEDSEFVFENIGSCDLLEIDLNGKTITTAAGWTAKNHLFHFKNCNISKIYIHNGTIVDVTGNLASSGIFIENCSGLNVIDGITSTLTAATTRHIGIDASRAIVKNCVFTSGTNGIYATQCAHVLSQDNSSVVDATAYGIVSTTGSIIAKYDATQPAGTTADELEAFGGVIN